MMKMGINYPMDPLEPADFIGLDVYVDILDVLCKGFGDPRYPARPDSESMSPQYGSAANSPAASISTLNPASEHVL
jgi:3-hydroxyacyl-CoA dehydrogenase